MKEALRYLQNAKELLAGVPIENNNYTDVKPVREAFGTAYLAILEAINEALAKRGIQKRRRYPNRLTPTGLPYKNTLPYTTGNWRVNLSFSMIPFILPGITEDLSMTQI